MNELTREDLKLGHTYRAKRFKQSGFGTNNDRVILHIGSDSVQYDSDTVRTGRHYPSVSFEKFLKWAKEDVTHLYKKSTEGEK